MNQLIYEIGYDESVSRWWITDMQREAFESPYETFEAEVNLGEAYVQIVYPVRKAFLEKHHISQIEPYRGDYDKVYFPFENNRVDFTTFIHTPHHIWVYGKTGLMAETAGTYEFELFTCGGIKLWVNGAETAVFAPYTRNIPGSVRVELSLDAGFNSIEIYADELAERDVFFYFELRYKGRKPVSGVIELECGPKEVEETELFLKSCYFSKDIIEDGEVLLHYDNSTLANEKNIHVMGDLELGDEIRVKASPNHKFVSLGNICQFKAGAFKVFLCCQAGGFPIVRELLLGIWPKEIDGVKPEGTIAGRKRQALAFLENQGEKVMQRALALLETQKQMTPLVEECIDNSLKKIEQKEDCADFYLVPTFILLDRYRKYLSVYQLQRIKKAVLQFRYWIDEPGNDVMWYFSENHAMLFHAAQYLAGNTYPEEMFSVSGKTGRQQYEIGKERLKHWFSIFFEYGYAEWNSATYIPVDLFGFFTLYMEAPDEEIRSMAKRAMDVTFRIIAYNSFKGVMSSSFGRVYEDSVKCNRLPQPNFLQWVATGDGYLSTSSSSVALFAISDYEPEVFEKELSLSDGEGLSCELDQGVNRIKTYSFRTNQYFIASVRRFKAFEHGHQQHLMNAVLGREAVPFFINHPGERPYSGGNRPSYWAGNGTIPYIEQYKNIILMIYKINPDELVHYIHAYTPAYRYDEWSIEGNWMFISAGTAYLGAWFSNQVKMTDWGANTGKEVISEGLRHGVVVMCGSLAEHGSFLKFKEMLKRSRVEYDREEELIVSVPGHSELRITDRILYCNGLAVEYGQKPETEIKRGLLSYGTAVKENSTGKA